MAGYLKEWSYFPKDVDTADLADDAWWSALVSAVVQTATGFNAHIVCSPAPVPRSYGNEYFARLVSAGNDMKRGASGGLRVLQSAIVGMSDLAQDGSRAMAIASLLSATQCDGIYLVLVGDTNPRRELNDPEELKGAMRLIAALENSGLRVFVAFCSSDLVLWKAAGASDCATGKYFNLRRFTKSRWEEPQEGGGNLPYWFEESLMAYLRESDLVRVRHRDLLSTASLDNPFGPQILDALARQPPEAWLKLSWCQYLYWFASIEDQITERQVDVANLLERAENNWQVLEDSKPQILMEERYNTGAWLRQWRRALLEYSV